jgi:hypothetical protein
LPACVAAASERTGLNPAAQGGKDAVNEHFICAQQGDAQQPIPCAARAWRERLEPLARQLHLLVNALRTWR